MTRNKLRHRYVVYDENGDRVARISVGHNGEFAHSNVDSELLTAVPSHQINKKNISDKEVADTQTRPLSQTLARTRYNNITGKTDDWEYKCPLLRKSVNELESGKDGNTSRIQWIKSPRGTSLDADPHIYLSTLAKYDAQNYLPKWALEDIAHKIDLDGFAQIISYNILQYEKELVENSDEELSSDEIYIHTVDKYRMKFTAKELEELETLVPQKIEEHQEKYDKLVEKYRTQWFKALYSHTDVGVDWYTYYGLNGPEFETKITKIRNKLKKLIELDDEKKDKLQVRDETVDEMKDKEINKKIIKKMIEKSNNLEHSDTLDYIDFLDKVFEDSDTGYSEEDILEEFLVDKLTENDEDEEESENKKELIKEVLDCIENEEELTKEDVLEYIEEELTPEKPKEPETWVNNMREKFEKEWDTLVDKMKTGELSVTTDKITPRPVSAIDDPNKDLSVTTENNSDYKYAVYREWWQTDETPALSMYCPNCGDKVYTDHGEHHTFDYSLKVDCHTCDMRLTPYNIITTPRNEYNKNEIHNSEIVEFVLKSYWNRAMRYGFRLGDRIAVDLRATEFKYYADQLDINWDMKCPFYRKPVSELDNEGLDDVEFNHIEYEDDDGNSRAQMAEGFTVSRSAHDILHMNHPQWMWEYYMGDPVEQRKYQIYKLIKEEKVVYESIYNTEVEQLDSDYLDHIRRYYDIGHYAKDELINIYIEVAEQEDDIVEAYKNTKGKCANKFAGNNDKGLDTTDQVKQFIQAKEERNEQYLSELQERAENGNIDAFEGDEMGLIHPLVKQYE